MSTHFPSKLRMRFRLRFKTAPAFALLAGIVLLPAGCRMGSPIYVWTPPKMHSVVGKRIAIDKIAGDELLATKIHEQLLASVPQDAGRTMTLVDARTLESKSPIQLTSAFADGANDVALASVARTEGYDYILRGEIVQDRMATPTSSNRLAVSWRLLSLDPSDPNLAAKHVGGQPVVVELKSELKSHPDLALLPDKEQILATAIARKSYELFAPSIFSDRVELAVSYVTPGSREVRRGISLALAGRWGEAETIWQNVYDSHPSQTAALHNLAVAAVAAQDFTRAKQLIRQAIQQRSNSLNQETLAWIELRQREYHEAFGLPDPPEGWFVTKGF